MISETNEGEEKKDPIATTETKPAEEAK